MRLDQTASVAGGERVEVAIALDASAPGAARRAVTHHLGRRVAASQLDDAKLLVSELVTNSLQHGDGPYDGQIVLTIELTSDRFRIGVQDSGSDATIAARPPNLKAGGGFGLALVQMLSERWGVERLARGGVQVWAQLLRFGSDAGAATGPLAPPPRAV
jgi:anti-sigma regulatory factor (Ser/Thr protein kinase)